LNYIPITFSTITLSDTNLAFAGGR
jgi:hypothetical protein